MFMFVVMFCVDQSLIYTAKVEYKHSAVNPYLYPIYTT